MKMWRESVRTEKIMEAYTGFAQVYDTFMDNVLMYMMNIWITFHMMSGVNI